MFHSYALKPAVWHEKPIAFEWDPDTGEIRGPDAEKVKALAAMAIADGSVVSHPHPTSYDIEDPLRRPAEMAVLLGMFWELPEELKKHYPSAENEDGLTEGAEAHIF